MKKLKILYTIPNFNTAGSGKVVYDLVKGLDKEKFEPAILVKHTRGDFFKEVEKLGVPIYVFNYETEYYPLWSFPFRLWKVVRFFKSLKVDIVHSWHWSSDFSEPLAVRLAGIKFIYTKKNMSWGNKAWVWKSKLANHIVTINTVMKELYFKTYHNVSYIPVGIDTEYYSPLPKKDNVDGINLKNRFVIISVANMVPVKGIEILIEAFIALKSEFENEFALLLVGSCEGEYGSKIKSIAKHHSDIYFLGKQMDVRPYLAEANVFVIPSLNIGRKEAQGVAPLEAMAMGIPVLASDLDGIRDIMIDHKDNLFRAGDIQELTTKLKQKVQSKSINFKTKKLGIPKLFSKNIMIKSYSDLYLKAI